VVVGAGVGLMMAPNSGVALRQDLRARLHHDGEQVGTFPPAMGTGEHLTKPH
jgi:hypothetical protein